MRFTPLLLSIALVAGLAAPGPVLASKESDAAAAAIILGLALGAAIKQNNRNNANNAADRVFYPADMPGVSCYTKAQQCYYRGNYSARATRAVFWN